MTKLNTGRRVGVGLLATAVVASLLAVIPAFGVGHEDAVRLHIGSDAPKQFVYPLTNPATVQPVTLNKGCEINPLAGALVTLSAKAGLVGHSIGVKSPGSNANGSPCGQIDSTETLILTDSYTRDWRKLRLDLELKGNAWVMLTLKQGVNVVGTFRLVTGTSIAAYNAVNSPPVVAIPGFPYVADSNIGTPDAACASASDSGPDSGPNDNCLWSIDPGAAFNQVLITTSVGTATLEGSGDFANDPNHDSLFFFFNHPPTVGGSATVLEDTPTVLTVATDLEGAALTTSCTSVNGGTVTAGPGNGQVTYTTPTNSNIPDTLNCTASDGETTVGGSFSVTVTPVNDAPVADNDTAETNENTAVIIDVLNGDTDVDGGTLTVGSVTPGTNGGSVINNTSDVIYTPATDFVGTDTFTYTAFDEAANSNSATVTVTVAQVICSNETVSDTDGQVTGSFTRLSDSEVCKPYELQADAEAGTILFQPQGTVQVTYRAYLQFEPDAGPVAGPGGSFSIGLEYDPNGLDAFQALQMCTSPAFDITGNVTSATLPSGETWCIASFNAVATTGGMFQTVWQVYGIGDPKFR